MRYDDTDNIAPLAGQKIGVQGLRIIADTTLLRGAVQGGATVQQIIDVTGIGVTPLYTVMPLLRSYNIMSRSK